MYLSSSVLFMTFHLFYKIRHDDTPSSPPDEKWAQKRTVPELKWLHLPGQLHTFEMNCRNKRELDLPMTRNDRQPVRYGSFFLTSMSSFYHSYFCLHHSLRLLILLPHTLEPGLFFTYFLHVSLMSPQSIDSGASPSWFLCALGVSTTSQFSVHRWSITSLPSSLFPTS